MPSHAWYTTLVAQDPHNRHAVQWSDGSWTVEEIQKELKDKDIDELDDYINKKFDELDQAFKKKSISIQESCTRVISYNCYQFKNNSIISHLLYVV
ncbi:hypothetical protein RIR_jg15622.t1 [Rhizophagus irregularis DAOM 181602=DAOM 197198]|nr:hypothetical protein RIR_jg15622.t1 [Rhizophagus irregularis DAOM 181602=DAOM 197198]CAG8478766.1 5674_t:CDS:2 [Rhizophagus irregularis]